MDNKKRIRIIGFLGIIILIVVVILYINNNENNKEYFIGLSYEELNKKIEDKDNFILCVSSTTCSHCAQFKPKLKDIAKEYKVELYYTDIDLYNEEENKDFSDTYKITGTPTTLIFIDGKELSVMNRIEGDVSKDKILTALRKYDFIDE